MKHTTDTTTFHLPATLEACIPALRTLRDRSDEAEEAFIRGCMAVEASPLWTEYKSPRQTTFGDWLQAVHVCGVERYNRGAAALRSDVVSAMISKIGIEAGKVAVETPDGQRAAVLAGLVGYSDDHKCRVPSRTATEIRDRLVGGKARESLANLADARVRKLEEANAKLREEVNRLKDENRKLRDKLAGQTKKTA